MVSFLTKGNLDARELWNSLRASSKNKLMHSGLAMHLKVKGTFYMNTVGIHINNVISHPNAARYIISFHINDVKLYHIQSYVMSCHIKSCPIKSRQIKLNKIESHHIMFCHMISNQIISYKAISCNTKSKFILSNQIKSYQMKTC